MPTLGGSALYLPVNMCAWSFASLAIAYGLWQMHDHGEVVFSRMQSWIWVGALVTLIPFAYPFPSREWAIPRFLGLFGGLLFLFTLYQSRTLRERRFTLLYLLLGAVLIECALGLTQFYAPRIFPWVAYQNPVYQPYGVFMQRNVMASFLATGLAVSIWLLVHDAYASRLRRGLCYAVLPVAMMVLVVGQSRTGQLGAILAIVLLMPALVRERRERVVLVLGLIALGLFAGWLALGAAPARITDPVGLRRTIWSLSMKLFMASPWVGYGYGGFEATYLGAYGQALIADPALPLGDENVSHPHNEILYWAVEGGIVPLIGIGIAVAGFFFTLRQAPWRKACALLALVAPMVLHTQTEFPFDISITHWLVFLLLVFVIDLEVEDVRTYRYRLRVLAPTFAILIPLVVIPFMVTAIDSNWKLIKYQRSRFREYWHMLDIVNRVAVLGQFEYNAYTSRINTGKRKDLEAYIAWGRRTVPHHPRAIVYVNMVLALDTIGKPDEAEKLRREAALLYPRNPILNGTIPIAVARGQAPPDPAAAPYFKRDNP